MKVNFNETIKNLEGIDITDELKNSITLKIISVNALTMATEDKITGDKKMKRFLLAEKIYLSNEPISLTSEEVTELKDIIGKSYSPIVVGRAYRFLEGE